MIRAAWLAPVVVVVASGTLAHGGEKDGLRTRLETQFTWDGRLGWKDLRPGSYVEHRTTQEGVPTTETRETLVVGRDSDPAIRTERRTAGGVWTKGPVVRLAILSVPGAQRRVEPLGTESVDVGGKAVPCTKERWTRVVSERPTTPVLVVWWASDGVPVKWETHLGDGWKSTYLVLRTGVEHRVGEKTLRCREVRKTSTSSDPSTSGMTFESVELWCDDVPDLVVRQVTQGPAGGPGKGPQVRELVAFEAK